MLNVNLRENIRITQSHYFKLTHGYIKNSTKNQQYFKHKCFLSCNKVYLRNSNNAIG